MQVFHTAGVPPSSGNRILPNIGCSTNIRVALVNKVPANKKTGENKGLAMGCGVLFIIIMLVVKRVSAQ